MDQRWFEDMMSQTYNEDICFNPSKLLLLKFISKDGIIAEKYKISDFQKYLYRVYSDNPQIAEKHPSYIVRKIHTYGVADFEEMALDTLRMWIRDAKNGILKCGTRTFLLDIAREDAIDTANKTIQFASMMYKRKFGGDIPDINNAWDEDVLARDHDLNEFGRCKYLQRVLEDIQYCPICEQIGEEKLYCVHIFEKRMGASKEELKDQNNGLVFCKEHAYEFINNMFYFDEFGFVKNINSKTVEPGMHLSFSIRNPQRKFYITRRIEWMKEQNII